MKSFGGYDNRDTQVFIQKHFFNVKIQFVQLGINRIIWVPMISSSEKKARMKGIELAQEKGLKQIHVEVFKTETAI